MNETGLLAVVAAVGGAVGAVVAALASALVMIMKERNKGLIEEKKIDLDAERIKLDMRAESDRTAFELQANEVRVLRMQMEAQQRAIDRLSAENAECHLDLEGLYGHVRLLHDVASRQASAIEALGGTTGPVPELPPRPHRRTGADSVGFAARTAAHNAGLISGLQGPGPDKETAQK